VVSGDGDGYDDTDDDDYDDDYNNDQLRYVGVKYTYLYGF
jgi:hypothetical protein